jgi:hypothetical protein
MPVLWITEYGGLAVDHRGAVVPLPAEPSFTQMVAYGKATACEAFRPDTCYVRLVGNADAYVAFGLEPVATIYSEPILARCEAFRRVRPGHRISIYDGVS